MFVCVCVWVREWIERWGQQGGSGRDTERGEESEREIASLCGSGSAMYNGQLFGIMFVGVSQSASY